MAFLNLKITVHMLIIILVNKWAHAVSGHLIVKPRDTYVLSGQVAILNCSSSSTEGVHWYHGTIYVYAGGNLYSPYKDRLRIEVYQNDGTTAFNLVFPSTKPEDAGTFICRDNQGRGELSSAEMTVLDADGKGTCLSNMEPDGLVIPNDCNIDPDEVQLSCGVTFYGNKPPQLHWRKVPEDGNSVANTECQIANNRVICNTSIIGDGKMNGSSFVCQTTGSPELNISLCSIPVKNLLYACNGVTTSIYDLGNEVQCNLETSQQCDYKWKHSETVVSTSGAITPNRTGLYQCEAECNIRGKRCIVFGYVYINNEDSTSCSTGCVIAICQGILILILVITISIFIHCFILKNRKDKTRNERDLEMRLAEKGTQQEQTSLMQPPETNKTRNERDLEMRLAEKGTQQEQTSLMQPPETIVDESKLIRTLIPNASCKQQKAVFGLAILEDELFASSHEYSKIEVFGDLQKLEARREFLLTGHILHMPYDIQSSARYKCLYIVDGKRNEEQIAEIIRINRTGKVEKKWTTDCTGGRLSVTNEFNIIVTSPDKNKMKEYSPDGDLIRSIELSSDVGILNPWVTLKRNENEYIISHGNRGDSLHRVCLLNQKMSIKKYFGGKKGSSNDQLNIPVHISATSGGHIFVADKDNSRVVLLSPELKFIKTLCWQDDYLRFPNRLCLDEQNERLFVCDNRWLSSKKPWIEGRILVFDISSVLASCNAALK